jgi:hypothetical protein
MADLGTMRIPDVTVVGQVDPAGACPVCLSRFAEVEASVSVRATPGERHGNVIDMHLGVAAMTLTALPCGHVVHQKEDGD